MVKRIIWSKPAKEELKEIIAYWNSRNKSNTYSKRIRNRIKIYHQLLKINPYIGQKTNYKSIRSKTVMEHFQLIYKIQNEQIIVLNFWDSRQNPKNKPYR